jgi:hypothetical protein
MFISNDCFSHYVSSDSFPDKCGQILFSSQGLDFFSSISHLSISSSDLFSYFYCVFKRTTLMYMAEVVPGTCFFENTFATFWLISTDVSATVFFIFSAMSPNCNVSDTRVFG